MNVLGVSAFYHDAAAALVRDGALVAAAQEERFTRIKHDPAMPRHAMRWCLEAGHVRDGELDAVVFYDKPIDKFVRILETAFAVAPRGLPVFVEAVPVWLRRKLWTGYELERALVACGHRPPPVLYTEHHESHAASAFFPSPFDRAAILTVDGVGEWATAAIGRGEGNRVTLLEELRFPHSLGLLYSAFTAFCGFEVNEGEYQLMGLAAFGEPRYASVIRDRLLDLKPDGSFALNLDYFGFLDSFRMTNRRFARLFDGPPRRPGAPVTPRERDLARSVQLVTEEILLAMARHAKAVTGESDLVLAGGVALNCVANGRLVREGPFARAWIQPAAGDAGGAVGAAFAGFHHHFGKPRDAAGPGDRMRGALLGPAWSDTECAAALARAGRTGMRLADDAWAPELARRLAAGRVIGLCQGPMEFGPRALGNRSIVADPRPAGMKDRVNERIKFREPFRPFGPAVLADRAADLFDLDRPSPYMLLTAPVKGGVAGPIPAVTHVDGSARIQTVDPGTNPRFHALLSAFAALTGCPALLNTSFNVKGQPIVNTPSEALATFARTGLDDLALGPFLVARDPAPPAGTMNP